MDSERTRSASLLRAGLLIAAAATLMAAAPAGVLAFPRDFQAFSGFGGDDSLDQAGNRARVAHVPVILIHGNGGSATHHQWGMTKMRDMLYQAGYNPSEVWAVSYLSGGVELSGVHKNHIDDLRRFIEAVKGYLGVQKVDLVGHSLSATMARAYVMGFQRSGKFDPKARAGGSVSTLVSLAGANDGLGPYSIDEFQTGGPFLRGLSSVGDVEDQTPFGSNNPERQEGGLAETTPVDGGQIVYVALWATGDFVDQQHPGTGALRGADLNKAYSLGMSLTGHERIIKDPRVVADFLPYLNRGRSAAVAQKGGRASAALSALSERGIPSMLDLSSVLISGWDGQAADRPLLN